ncbi:MAG: hypothetical protein BHV73_13315 [Bacteroides sp. 44_46]|nr:MAG: hypothetical protein BHV73_13315 [Bacteroides sp. 44_46]
MVVIGNFNMNNMINIAFAPDDNYVMPTCVAITSVLENTHTEITIYIIYIKDNLSERNRTILKNTICNYNQNVCFVKVNKDDLQGFPNLRHGLSAYLRILAPKLFPNINKLLYLDGDLIINYSISDLYNIDIKDYQLAAVSDLKPLFTPNSIPSIGYSYNHPYFNSGVLLMNLKELRKIDLQERVKVYLETYKDRIYNEDQDILNCVCPLILNLEPKYNSIIHLWNKNITYCKKLWTDQEIDEAKRSPIIIHYLGGHKPWKYETRHPFKTIWYHYLKKTYFYDYTPHKSFRKFLSLIKGSVLQPFK